MQPVSKGPIGVFDSGYGGLSILRELRKALPQYDYVFLGDNARAPYGSRSFDVVYQFTRQTVERLFEMGCPLVVLACNTASAKALRTIQQNDLPVWDPSRRVLGIIRPTVEQVGALTSTRHIGIFGTKGTISSGSYPIEIAKFFPDVAVTGHACPMWVPLVENGEYDSDGADYFVKKEIDAILAEDPLIDMVILGCTHYPLLEAKIRRFMPEHVRIVPQGTIVAQSLAEYLDRHDDMHMRLTTNGSCTYLTTENPDMFRQAASAFLDEDIEARHTDL